MMLTALRGLILAAGALTMPAYAQVDCPSETSIDRYTQTAGDALVALHELVPTSQQRALEDRYAAMLILKWKWQGRDNIRDNTNGMNQLLSCYQAGACGIDPEDQITLQIVDKLSEFESDPLLLESLLPRQPSDSALDWAQTTLDCFVISDELEDEDVQDEETEAPVLEEEAPLETAEVDDAEPVEEEPVLAEADPVDAIEPDPEDLTLADTVTSTAVEPIEADPVEETVEATVAISAETSAEVAELMLKATNLVAAGKLQAAVEPLESACFTEAALVEKSNACETLFSVYANASESSSSTQNYLSLSERLCDFGHSRGCDNLSQYHAAQNRSESKRSAVLYAERSCDLSNAETCATLAELYLSGYAGEPDPEGAREALERSCTLGRLLSCQQVADYYTRGVGGEPDRGTALKMIEASCPAGATDRPDLCVSAADYILINEQDSAQRGARVRAFIERACMIGHGVGCAWYAEDLELGIGGAVDLYRASQARVTACEFGDQESCNSRS